MWRPAVRNAFDPVALIAIELLEFEQLAKPAPRSGASSARVRGARRTRRGGPVRARHLAAARLAPAERKMANSPSAAVRRIAHAVVDGDRPGEDLAMAGRVDELHPAPPVTLLGDRGGHRSGQTFGELRRAPWS